MIILSVFLTMLFSSGGEATTCSGQVWDGSACVTPYCLYSFQGLGYWALVRRVAAGSQWHTASDDLGGQDVYGVYGGNGTFSTNFQFMKDGNTEILFTTGM